VTGTKTWEDAGNQDGKRPAEITIHLLKNGRQIATKKVTEADSWKWNFDNLDKYENGKEITYTIVEEKVKGYTSTVKGFDITNSYTPSKTSIQVTKAWDDANDQDGVRPSSVTIKLLADGKDTGKKIVLEKDNNWTGNFTNLDEYKDGKKVVYSVSEETVGNGYTTVITGDIQKGFLVTNKRTPHTPPKETEGELPNTGTDVSFTTLGIIALMAGFGLLKKQRRDGFF
ncbi:MAG: Cna B-type domain-containing protein, partial [Carnobacterium sp.]|nr:Cna B-type domain-containing protein [Carnobacterium sp.]